MSSSWNENNRPELPQSEEERTSRGASDLPTVQELYNSHVEMIRERSGLKLGEQPDKN